MVLSHKSVSRMTTEVRISKGKIQYLLVPWKFSMKNLVPLTKWIICVWINFKQKKAKNGHSCRVCEATFPTQALTMFGICISLSYLRVLLFISRAMYINLSSDLNNDSSSIATTHRAPCYVPDEAMYISLFSASQQSHEEGTMIIPIL